MAEIHETLEQNADIEAVIFADRGLEAKSDAQGQVKDVADLVEDSKFSSSQSNNDLSAFVKPPSQV